MEIVQAVNLPNAIELLKTADFGQTFLETLSKEL